MSELIPVPSVGQVNVSSVIVKTNQPEIPPAIGIVNAGTINLYKVHFSVPSACFIMLFDALEVPAAGAVAYPVMRHCIPTIGPQFGHIDYGQHPDVYANGVIVACSSTGYGTFTPMTAYWLAAQAE